MAIGAKVERSKNKSDTSSSIEEYNEWKATRGYWPEAQHSLTSAGQFTTLFEVDSTKQTILIFNKKMPAICIAFSDLVDGEIHTDKKLAGSAVNAAIGGAIAGTTGAVIGAAKQKKEEVKEVTVNISTNNFSMPVIEIELFKSLVGTPIHFKDVQEAMQFANKILAIIKAILREQNRKTNS